MDHRSNRREFLKQAGLAGFGVWVAAGSGWTAPNSPNEKLNIGIIGCGGRGEANMNAVAGENIVALCDVDEQMLAKAAAKHTQAAKFNDFRKMLERNDIDAVTVSTPDHTHAHAAKMAMELGKHVYCEKPLTHSIHEARVLARTAARKKVATQMGNQGHSLDNTRRVVELIRAGAVGPIREVHCWTDRPIWPQGIGRPSDTPPVPEHVHWDLWLGPAPERPYHPAYHPFKWRGWWDFGTGALGDMACHVMDCAYWALDLDSPSAVEWEGSGRHPETAPEWEIIRYEFPQRGQRPAVRLTWYDGKKKPPAELAEGQKLPDNGTLFVGDKGKILLLDPYGGKHRLLPEAEFKDHPAPPATIPNSIGHHAEWITACKGGPAAGSNFAYSGPFTEMVLLGVVAARAGQRIEWDARRMRVKNLPEAERYVRREYRKGWEL